MPDTDTLVAAAEGGAEDPEPPRRLGLDVIVEAGDWAPLGDMAAHLAPLIAQLEQHPAAQSYLPATACLALADNATMRRLNGQFRSKDKPTNVLSFPAGAVARRPHGSEPAALGDIILGLETVLHEASQQGIGVHDHIQHLVLHGLLHLMGHDHVREAQAQIMEGLEIEILGALGIVNPYDEAALEPAAP